MIEIFLPLRIVSVANVREHWTRRHRRASEHRGLVKMALYGPLAEMRRFKTPLVVRLTRLGKKRLDGDNLQVACKAARDGVADALGIDDADSRVMWEYGQETGKYGLRIQVLEGA